MTAKIEPWIECAIWEIDSRCLETGAFFNRYQAANIIAAHAPKASLSAIFECIGGEDNIGVILPEQLKRLTLNVIMPLLLEPGRLGELALILNRLVLTAEAHAPKETGIKPDNAQAGRHEPGEFPIMPNKAYAANMQNKEYEPSVPVSMLKFVLPSQHLREVLAELIYKAEKGG